MSEHAPEPTRPEAEANAPPALRGSPDYGVTLAAVLAALDQPQPAGEANALPAMGG